MRLLAFCAFPLAAATIPVFELADVAEAVNHDARLKQQAIVAVTGEFSGILSRDRSPVIALFDKESGTAAGCALPPDSKFDTASLQTAHRYTAQGQFATWKPSERGGVLLLNACQLLPDPVELKKNTLYLGVISAEGKDTGFQLKLLDGGEGPLRASLTAIDPGHFLELWERRHGLPDSLRLTVRPTEWTGVYSRATGSFHFTRKDQELNVTLQSPASFAGKLITRKNLEATARMIVANSSGTLVDYVVTPTSGTRRPAVEVPSHEPARRAPVRLDTDETAIEWVRRFLETEAEARKVELTLSQASARKEETPRGSVFKYAVDMTAKDSEGRFTHIPMTLLVTVRRVDNRLIVAAHSFEPLLH